ncbi:hypothetical protein [Mameliella sp.]|uniref:hypothetical protein n=1 Tax=Mameliella sp. TaxID=1924940 RepID=UPI003BAC405F
MNAPIRKVPCAVDAAAQIGHNGGPSPYDLLRIIGPREARALPAYDCGAPWTGHASRAELIRVAKLQARIEMREAALKDLRAERTRIMMHCIRRMRRAGGVE